MSKVFDKIGSLITLLALITISFTVKPFRVLFGLTLSDVLMLAACFFFIIQFQKINYSKTYFINLASSLLIAIGYATSYYNSEFPENTILDSTKVFFTFTIGPWVLINFNRHNDKSLQSINALLIGLIIVSLIGGIELFTAKQFFHNENLWGRYASLTEHPNELGPFCAVFGVMAIGLLLNGKYKLLYGISSVTALIGIIASASMSAALGYLVGLALVLVINKKYVTLFVLTSLAFILYIAFYEILTTYKFGFNSIFSRLLDFFNSGSNYITAEQRKLSLELAFSKIQKNPFLGVGTSDIYLVPHNALIYAWWSSGILGLIGIVIIIFYNIWILIKMVFSSKQFDKKYLAKVILAALIVSLIENFVSPGSFRRTSWVIFWIAISFSAVSKQQYRNLKYANRHLA